MRRANKGRVEGASSVISGSNRQSKQMGKVQRRNIAKQVRANKINAITETKRLFEGNNGAAKVVAIIPLTGDISSKHTLELLLAPERDGITISQDSNTVVDVYVKKFKSNLKFLLPRMDDFINLLDCAKVADFVVLALSGVSEIDHAVGEQIIRALELQGIASYMGVIPNLSKVHPKEKFQLDVKQSLLSYFKHFFPDEEKLYNLEKSNESTIALRNLCQKFPKQINWRDQRGYLIADSVDFQINSPNDLYGSLIIEGTVRGKGFNVNRLVHLPNLGDFQLQSIEKLSSSNRSTKRSANGIDEFDLGLDKIFTPDNTRDTLDEFAPREFEMEDDVLDEDEDFQYDQLTSARYDDHGYLPGTNTSNETKQVPKGTSNYQAQWYLDDVIELNEDDEVEELNNDETADEDFKMEEDVMEPLSIDMETETNVSSDDGDKYEDLSPQEEAQQLAAFRDQEKEDREFPDEIELLPTESAIERLRRYRGLKNLQNCDWHVDEKDPHQPEVWKKLLRISRYKFTQKKILKDEASSVQSLEGDKVRLSIQFPSHLTNMIRHPRESLVAVYGLMLHEHKNAVVNFSFQRWEEYEHPVPSGQPLLVQYGIRRYQITPLFSGDSHSPNNVHRFERFLHATGVASIATCIAPVDFTQSPAIFFKLNTTSPIGIDLIGQGSFLNADHTRVLAKRAILTGHPFRFHKKLVTVRYMFFRPEDVEWFKSIPLFTKSGRTGFIKESLGTHGYYKATFDAKLSAQDIVAMSLYRRVWPKISEPWYG